MTGSSNQTKPKKKKKPNAVADNNVDSVSSVVSPSGDSSDATAVLLERRLFSSRQTKRLDLSIAFDHANARLPYALTPLQVFPRAIVTHEQVSGHRLRELWLTNHHLYVLPPDIALFSQLKVLGLAGNALTSLPPEIAQLPALESLFLEKNQLRGLPESVAFPRQLRDLRLDHNELTEVPVQITQLRLLQRLGLSYNRLTGLPLEMRRLINLVELDLDHNAISSEGFPDDSIARLRHLERLGLDGNRLCERPPCLLRMPSVRYVLLNGNRGVQEEEDGTADVPRRHDGYFQCVEGYQAAKAPSADVPASSAKRRPAALLHGLVPSQDQNLLNAMAYQPQRHTATLPLAVPLAAPLVTSGGR